MCCPRCSLNCVNNNTIATEWFEELHSFEKIGAIFFITVYLDCEQTEKTTMSCTSVCVYTVYILSTVETDDSHSFMGTAFFTFYIVTFF